MRANDYISMLTKPTRQWKITQNANLPDLTVGELHLIKKFTREQDATQLSKTLRAQYGLGRLYGKDYKRIA